MENYSSAKFVSLPLSGLRPSSGFAVWGRVRQLFLLLNDLGEVPARRL